MKKVVPKILFLFAILMTPFVCYAKVIVTNQGPAIDLTKKADLIIDFETIQYEPLPGAEFDIYKVANVGEYGTFTSVAPFNQYVLDFEYLDEEGWDALAQQLNLYVNDDKIDKTLSGKTDENGLLKFKNIDLGLYLVIGKTHIVGANTYTPQVFLISVPNMLEQDKWEYSVEVYPKYSYDLDISKIVDKKVGIVWDDDGFEERRPKYVTVEIYKDGQKFGEVNLSAENNWEHIWKDLDDSYEWTVKALIDSKDYISNVEYENGIYTITISYKISLPNTGMLWWPVPILFIVGLILFIVGIIVRDKEDEEE